MLPYMHIGSKNPLFNSEKMAMHGVVSICVHNSIAQHPIHTVSPPPPSSPGEKGECLLGSFYGSMLLLLTQLLYSYMSHSYYIIISPALLVCCASCILKNAGKNFTKLSSLCGRSCFLPQTQLRILMSK